MNDCHTHVSATAAAAAAAATAVAAAAAAVVRSSTKTDDHQRGVSSPVIRLINNDASISKGSEPNLRKGDAVRQHGTKMDTQDGNSDVLHDAGVDRRVGVRVLHVEAHLAVGKDDVRLCGGRATDQHLG